MKERKYWIERRRERVKDVAQLQEGDNGPSVCACVRERGEVALVCISSGDESRYSGSESGCSDNGSRGGGHG